MIAHIVTLTGTHIWGDDSTTAIVINAGKSLIASRVASSSLTAKGDIVYGGSGAIVDTGVEATPVPAPYTCDIILNYSATPVAGKYGIRSVNTNTIGRFSSWGATRTRNTTLTATANSGQKVIKVADVTGWAAGDKVWLPNTDGTVTHYEERIIDTISGLDVTVTVNLSYTHLINAPVGNGSSNVTFKNYSDTYPSYIYLTWSNSQAAGAIEIGQTCFNNLGSTAAQTKYGLVIWPNYALYTTAVVKTIKSCAFRAVEGGVGPLFGLIANRFEINDCALYKATAAATGAMSLYYGIACSINRLVTYAQTAAIVSEYGQGCQGVVMTDCYFSGNNAVANINFGASGGLTLRNCRFEGGNGGFYCISGAETMAEGCTFGVLYGMGNQIVNLSAAGLANFTLTNCNIVAGLAVANAAALLTANSTELIKNVNGNGSILNQGWYMPSGNVIRDNTTFKRSTSAIRIDTLSATATSFVVKILAANGIAVTIPGALRRNTAYGTSTQPYVTLSGLGITPQTVTLSAGADAWQEFALTATQNSGADGELSLTFVGQSATTTGQCWLDGVVYSPFVTYSVHYGYLDTPTSATKTVDPIITTATEATVAAYTGIAITYTGTPITTVTSSHTVDELYDYAQYSRSLTANHTRDRFFSSTDGVNYTLNQDLTISGAGVVLSGTANIDLNGHALILSGGADIGVGIEIRHGASSTTFKINVTGAINGTRIIIKNITDVSEVAEFLFSTSYSKTVTHTGVDKTLALEHVLVTGATAKAPDTIIQTLTAAGCNFLVQQIAEPVYNANAINGSAVTGLVLDAPNIEIDADEVDNHISAQEIYAWYLNALMTTASMRVIFDAITPINSKKYRVNKSIVGLLFDNIDLVNTLVITGGVIYADDGASIRKPGSGSIEMIPDDVYESNAAEASLAAILAKTDVATSTRLSSAGYSVPDNAGISAIKAKTDNLPASPAATSSIPTTAEITTAINASTILAKELTLASVKSKTDLIISSVSGTIDVNVHRVNNLDIDGVGTEADPWGPA